MVKIRVLGTAAGGGCPQWNCACPQCNRVRHAEPEAWRTHDSLAISGTGEAWYLVNAAPDVRHQILAAPELTPGPGIRRTPLRGVLLTSAELDHTIGLAILREGTPLQVYAPSPVIDALFTVFPLRDVLAPYTDHEWLPVEPGKPFTLDERLRITAVPLSDKRPRYARDLPGDRAWVVAYRIEDEVTGGSLVYAPNLAAWPPALDDAAADADCVIVDGTFLNDDEPVSVMGGTRSATQMGHLPILGPDGIAERLVRLPARRRLLTHLNNTNPLLDPHAPQHSELAAAGIEVAADGTTLEL
jgi:pyrroloquinoline quinone biosynthesis protein B